MRRSGAKLPMQRRQMRKLSLMGGPGSGKSTQCQKIADKFGFLYISIGELLREEIAKNSPIGKECEQIMKEGQLVPVLIVLKLLKSAMDASTEKHFLIDGFPRSVEQAQAFEAHIGMPDMVINLDCPSEILTDRLLQRAKTSGRVDDNLETIRKRIQVFMDQTLPVLDYYEKSSPNILKQIDGTPPPADVFMEISNVLKKTFGFQEKASDPKA